MNDTGITKVLNENEACTCRLENELGTAQHEMATLYIKMEESECNCGCETGIKVNVKRKYREIKRIRRHLNRLQDQAEAYHELELCTMQNHIAYVRADTCKHELALATMASDVHAIKLEVNPTTPPARTQTQTRNLAPPMLRRATRRVRRRLNLDQALEGQLGTVTDVDAE